MRSSTHDGIHEASKAIDGLIGHHDSFGSAWQINNWFQLDMGEPKVRKPRTFRIRKKSIDLICPFQLVGKVDIVKRESVQERFKNVELRIGNESIPDGFGYMPLTINELTGTYFGNNSDTTAVFEVEPAVSGRFLSHLELDEINVFECTFS